MARGLRSNFWRAIVANRSGAIGLTGLIAAAFLWVLADGYLTRQSSTMTPMVFWLLRFLSYLFVSSIFVWTYKTKFFRSNENLDVLEKISALESDNKALKAILLSRLNSAEESPYEGTVNRGSPNE